MGTASGGGRMSLMRREIVLMTGKFAIILSLLWVVPAVSVQAADADCWQATGRASIDACSNIISSKRINGKRTTNGQLAIVYHNRGSDHAKQGDNDRAIAD